MTVTILVIAAAALLQYVLSVFDANRSDAPDKDKKFRRCIALLFLATALVSASIEARKESDEAFESTTQLVQAEERDEQKSAQIRDLKTEVKQLRNTIATSDSVAASMRLTMIEDEKRALVFDPEAQNMDGWKEVRRLREAKQAAEREVLTAKRLEDERMAITEWQPVYDEFLRRFEQNLRSEATRRGEKAGFSPVLYPSQLPKDTMIAQMSIGTNTGWHLEVWLLRRGDQALTTNMPPALRICPAHEPRSHRAPTFVVMPSAREVAVRIYKSGMESLKFVGRRGESQLINESLGQYMVRHDEYVTGIRNVSAAP